MKKYITSAFVVAAFALSLVAIQPAQAATYTSGPRSGSTTTTTTSQTTTSGVSWNTGAGDCPTVSVANDTTQQNASADCWGPSVSAQPGDHINVRIHYHNNGSVSSTGTTFKLNMPSGTNSSFSFTGFVNGSGVQSLGSGNINLSQASTLTLNKVWYTRDSNISPIYVSGDSLFTSGLNIGTVAPETTCTTTTRCHQGDVVASFIVGGATNNTTSCVITSFMPNPSTVTSGSSSTLSWNTTGCTTVSVTTGGEVDTAVQILSTQISGTATTGPVYGTKTYTISASGPSNTATPQVVIVTTTNNNNNNCSITGFGASPSSVAYGASTYLTWSTTGCTSVALSGGNVYGTQAVSGGVSTGALYNTTTYILNAYGPNGAATSQSISVFVNGNNNNNNSCVISNIYASPSSVAYGSGTTLYWSNLNGGAVTITGGNISSSYQYGSSMYTGAIYSTTTFTVTPVNCTGGGYAQGQSVTVYVNGNNNQQTGSVTPITTLATNVSAYSARLNGLISGTSYASVNAYFEYGTDQNLGLQTTQQLVTAGTMTNYFDTISTSPNTTYFYRAAIVVNGTIYRGSIISFTTPALTSNGGGTVYVNTNTSTGVSYGVGAGSAFLSLSMTDQFQGIAPGDMIIYTINYKNITAKPLTNAVLNVILPAGVTFRQSTQGMLTTNNTVVANLGTINSLQEGTVTIQAMVDNTVTPGSTLVATTTIAFTTPSGAQDSAVAYAVNTVTQRNYLTGLALFGYGFFPSTLLGWIILLAIIILLVLLARHLTARRAPVVMAAPRNDYHDHH